MPPSQHRIIDAPREWLGDLAGLFLPRRCAACDRPLIRAEASLCLGCLHDLPRLRLHQEPGNRVERLFWGKVPVEAAAALLQFNRSGKVQRILHRLKYTGDRTVGLELGRMMAEALQASERFHTLDTILAVPLHSSRLRERGFNQSQILVDGFREVWPLQPMHQSLMRVTRTATQTRKGRWDRWTNVKEAFDLASPEALAGAHVLVVDDVVTTGATLEGCIRALTSANGLRVSVCTAATA
ncbi:MAG: ComF family protein [Flavobacteriales bacterium]|nr:ComF family protein [Flavobacteriales bacterium]